MAGSWRDYDRAMVGNFAHILARRPDNKNRVNGADRVSQITNLSGRFVAYLRDAVACEDRGRVTSITTKQNAAAGRCRLDCYELHGR